MEKLLVKKLSEHATIPTRNIHTDAGADIYALDDTFIQVGTTVVVHTGIAMHVPVGLMGKVEDRSSMAKLGLRVGGGVIDSGYNGEISVVLHNLTNTHHSSYKGRGYLIKAGDKVAQLLIVPVLTPEIQEVSDLWQSERGGRGFGSSGR